MKVLLEEEEMTAARLRSGSPAAKKKHTKEQQEQANEKVREMEGKKEEEKNQKKQSVLFAESTFLSKFTLPSATAPPSLPSVSSIKPHAQAAARTVTRFTYQSLLVATKTRV